MKGKLAIKKDQTVYNFYTKNQTIIYLTSG